MVCCIPSMDNPEPGRNSIGYLVLHRNTTVINFKRLRQGTGINEEFGGVYMYLFGDIRQIPSVCDSLMYSYINITDNMNTVRGKESFQNFNSCKVLQHSQRQTDSEFKNILDNLSTGDTTDEDYQLLRTRFMCSASQTEKENFNDALHLLPTVKEVQKFNKQALETLKRLRSKGPAPVAFIPAVHNSRTAANGSLDDADGLPPTLALAVGCNVMLRANLWIAGGLVYGIIGTIVDIIYAEDKSPPDDLPELIMYHFGSYEGKSLTKQDHIVPIPSINKYWTAKDGSSCSRKNFPLAC